MVFLMTLRLGTLFDGVSDGEAASINSVHSPIEILENPISLPHRAILMVLGQTDLLSVTSARLVSIGFSIAAIILFYILVRAKFSARITLLGSLAFCANSVFLGLARNAGFASSTLFAACAVLAALQLYSNPKGFTGKGWVCGILLGLAIFSPGAIILFILAGAWHVRRTMHTAKVWPITALIPVYAIPVISLAILTYGFYRDYTLLYEWFGVPNALPEISTFAQNAMASIQLFFFRAEPHPEFLLARTPVLDIFTTVCFVVGVAYAHQKTTTSAFAALFGIVAASICYIALRDPILSLPLLMPIIFLGVTAGITMLLRQWLDIFPRNPFARTIGVTVMTIVVGISCLYQMNRYFVAFSQTPENRAIYSKPLILEPAATQPAP